MNGLGMRMKCQYEDRFRFYLPRRTYTIIRIDGKSFNQYTRQLKKPFDHKFMADIDSTALYLCANLQGSVCAYCQSDEISILMTDFNDIQTQAAYDGNIQKLSSISASMATAAFNINRTDYLDRGIFAIFDSRVFIIPDPIEVANYFIWRQKDWVRNSVTMVAQMYASPKQLENKSSSERHEIIFNSGDNWSNYPDADKHGRMILYRVNAEKEHSSWIMEIPPIFTQNKKYLYDMIPIMPSFDLEGVG